MASPTKKLRVVELFAGVGGFRLGLEGWKGKSSTSGYSKKMTHNGFRIVWSNQHEPGRRVQYANDIYNFHFGHISDSIHTEEPIENIDPKNIPNHDMIVGGFPCQDFSVGALNKFSKGLEGKKGVLWFEIERILKENVRDGRPTKYILLENVDRLLKCPVDAKGADFTKILDSLNSLDYAVEWKVINAGDYNMPQRRRRVFIIAYHKSTNFYKNFLKDSSKMLTSAGVLASSFKSEKYQQTAKSNFSLSYAKKYISSRKYQNYTNERNRISYPDYNKNKKIPSLFENSGTMVSGKVITAKHFPKKIKNKKSLSLYLEKKDLLIPKEFIVNQKDFKEKWSIAKSAKKIKRSSQDGFQYVWSEGSMAPFDDISKPARTIITSEGGKSASRTKHIIPYKDAYRRLLPSELDQLSMFPKNYTQKGKSLGFIPDSRRAFLVGNALVVGVIELIGRELALKLQYQNL